MIKTIFVCDQCKTNIDNDLFRVTVICSGWHNNLDFCHSNCLTKWCKERQKEMGAYE